MRTLITKPSNCHDLFTGQRLGRQRDLGKFAGQFQAPVPRHGVVLIRVEN